MCIAIFKKPGVKLYDSTLQNCWDNNSDGAGFMYAEKGKLHVQKGYFTFDEFMEAYKPHEDKKLVLHFRIRTHGDINMENCHPYPVDDNLAFIHNGIISDVQGVDRSKSDTWYFNELFLKPIRKLDKSFFLKPHYQAMINKFIGYSKLVFLNSKNEHAIINEAAGNWDSDCWFSNTSWKTSRRTTVSYYKTPDKDDTYYEWPFDPDTNVTPKKDTGSITVTPPSNYDKPLESGNVCWMKSEFGPLKYAEYVAIKYIYNDRTAAVYKTANPSIEARVPFSCLERTSIRGLEDKEKVVESFKPDEIVMFKRNFNHFRELDDVVVVNSVSNAITLVKDPINDKEYRVPTHILIPVREAVF